MIEFQADFNDIQRAFIQGDITIENLIEILIDNFGKKQAMIILKKNLKRAEKEERKRALKRK